MQGYIISSSSYDDHVAIPIVFYKYMPRISQILVSAEYHSGDEFFEPCACIGNIHDDCLVFATEDIKARLSGNISNCAINYMKRQIKDINNFFCCSRSVNISNIPIILILGLGHYSQQTNIEIMINNMIYKDNIRAYQYFSNSFWILRQGEKQFENLLEDENNITDPEIGVIGIEVNSKEQLLSDNLYNVVKQISPDYFIVCMENMREDYSKIDDICRIKFGKAPDVIALSDFFGFYSNEINIPIYELAVDNIRIRGEFYNLRGASLCEILHTNIFNTITSVNKIAQFIN